MKFLVDECLSPEVQLELFGHAPEELAIDSDMVNQVLEITLENYNGEVHLLRYRLPPEGRMVSLQGRKVQWLKMLN